MSDLTPEKLAELRCLLDEAPPLPYRDSPRTHGDPSEGPTYVALEARLERLAALVDTAKIRAAALHHEADDVENMIDRPAKYGTCDGGADSD